MCCSCGERAPRKKAGRSSEEFVRFRRRDPQRAKKIDIFQKRNPWNNFGKIIISQINFSNFSYFRLLFGNRQLIKTKNLKTEFFYEITAGNLNILILNMLQVYDLLCKNTYNIDDFQTHWQTCCCFSLAWRTSRGFRATPLAEKFETPIPSPSQWMQFRCLSSELVKYHGKLRLTCL